MTGRCVVHVSQPVDAGVAVVVLALAREQAAAGWQVHVVCPAGWLAERARAEGIGWTAWPATRDPGPGTAREATALRRALRKARPDLVHLHSSKAGLVGRLVLRGRTPTVFQPHAWSFSAAPGRLGQAVRVWERVGARWTSLLVCCSEEEAEEGRRAGIRGPAAVAVNGVDLQAFPSSTEAARAAARRALGIDPTSRVAVCAGRLSVQKGQDVLVAAWPQVRRSVPGAELLLAGDGPAHAALAAQAGPGVRLLGQVDDVSSLLAAADVAVLPSRWEGLALALLEAMASGRTVVATRVGGSTSTLLGGELPPAGAVVPVEDVDALAREVSLRLQDPDRAAAEGAAGRRRVEIAHDLRRTAAAVRELYELLLPSDSAPTISPHGG